MLGLIFDKDIRRWNSKAVIRRLNKGASLAMFTHLWKRIIKIIKLNVKSPFQFKTPASWIARKPKPPKRINWGVLLLYNWLFDALHSNFAEEQRFHTSTQTDYHTGPQRITPQLTKTVPEPPNQHKGIIPKSAVISDQRSKLCHVCHKRFLWLVVCLIFLKSFFVSPSTEGWLNRDVELVAVLVVLFIFSWNVYQDTSFPPENANIYFQSN